MAIIDLIKSQLSLEFISKAATKIGESESKVSKAIGSLMPAVLGGLANNAENPMVLNSLSDSTSSEILDNLLESTSDNPIINNLISSIFNNQLDDILDLVSKHSGVVKTSASSLMNYVTGTSIGIINRYATEKNLNKSDISKLLSEQKGLIPSLMPAGLSLGSFGFGNVSENAKEKISSASEKISNSIPVPKKEVAEKNTSLSNSKNKNGSSFWKWLIPLILLGIAVWFIWNQFQTKENTKTINKTAVIKDTVTNKANDTINISNKETVEILLPSGKTINAYKGGLEEQLVQFLKSDEYKNASEEKLKSKWFNFDNLNFEFNSEKLTQESQKQVDNLKSILTEFPQAKIKIGVFTDKVGDEKANLDLSQKRAEEVKTAIGSAQVIDAKGYGEQFAKIDEKASDTEREADRKTAIRLTK